MTQELAPDAILASDGVFAPSVGDVSDDPEAPDGAWLAAEPPFSIRFGFPAPSGELAGAQTIQALLRRSTAIDPLVTISLYEAGAPVRTLQADVAVTSAVGQIVTATFDASEIVNPANVEILIAGASPAAGVEEAPAYVSGLAYDTHWQQNTAIAPINLDACFSGGNLSYSFYWRDYQVDLAAPVRLTAGAVAAGVAKSGAAISGTPIGFMGRRRLVIRAENSVGFVERTILVSIRPDTVAGAFGVPYNGAAPVIGQTIAANTLQNASNQAYINCTFTGQIQTRNLTNVLFIDCSFTGASNLDAIRASNTGAGSNRIVVYNCTLTGQKDGINWAGDWPWHGPEIYFLNNYIYNAGNNADPKEHGMYIHTMAVIHGNIIYNSNYGNAISTRSSADIRCNFIYLAYGGGISYFCDHPQSYEVDGATERPWICRGNVVAEAGGTDPDGDFILRSVPTPANRLGVFVIQGNWGNAKRSLVEIAGSGAYAGANITNVGNATISAPAALAMFPATPWAA